MSEHPVVAFLQQAHSRAEESARAATPPPWTLDLGDETVMSESGTVARMRDWARIMTNAQVDADMQLIVGMAVPTAVLRRVAAEREMLDEHEATWSSGEPEYGHHTDPAVSRTTGRTVYVEVRDSEPIPPYWCETCQAMAPCRTVLLLAKGWGWGEA